MVMLSKKYLNGIRLSYDGIFIFNFDQASLWTGIPAIVTSRQYQTHVHAGNFPNTLFSIADETSL